MASLEEVSHYPLDDEQCEQLYAMQRLCVVCWSTSDGWPVGVNHRYLWANGKVWVTTSSQRHRVKALRNRPKSCVVISGDGTEMGPERTVTLKTECIVHEDRETIEWFIAEFARSLNPDDPEAQKGTIAMMDTPRRVVLELTPVKKISYDGMKLGMAIVSEGLTD